eukprot:3269841-Rhodomonas_salina.2
MERFGITLPLRNQYFIMRVGQNFSEKGGKMVTNPDACVLDWPITELGRDQCLYWSNAFLDTRQVVWPGWRKMNKLAILSSNQVPSVGVFTAYCSPLTRKTPLPGLEGGVPPSTAVSLPRVEARHAAKASEGAQGHRGSSSGLSTFTRAVRCSALTSPGLGPALRLPSKGTTSPLHRSCTSSAPTSRHLSTFSFPKKTCLILTSVVVCGQVAKQSADLISSTWTSDPSVKRIHLVQSLLLSAYPPPTPCPRMMLSAYVRKLTWCKGLSPVDNIWYYRSVWPTVYIQKTPFATNVACAGTRHSRSCYASEISGLTSNSAGSMHSRARCTLSGTDVLAGADRFSYVPLGLTTAIWKSYRFELLQPYAPPTPCPVVT